MADEIFQPFETRLDKDTALGLLRGATAGADDGELFLERRRGEVLTFDDGQLKSASFDASEGFGLRAVRGEAAGYAHSTEISETALRRAAETARLAVGDGGGVLADAPRPTNRRLYGDFSPIETVTFSTKVDVLAEIDAFARGRAGLMPVWSRCRPLLRPRARRSRSCAPTACMCATYAR